MAGIWPFSFYFFIFAGFAFFAPFLVLFYQHLGFSGAQIGLLSGLTPLVTMLGAPAWTAVADSTRRHQFIMTLVLLAGAIIVFLFPLFTTFAAILLVALLFNAFFAPVPSLADSATMYMLADKREMYGRLRLGGTIGFGLSAPLAGVLIQRYGMNLAFWGCAVLLLLALLTSKKLIFSPERSVESTRSGIRILLTNPRWLLFLVMAFAGGIALAGTNTFLFPFLSEIGANESTMGLALTIGILSEIPVLFFGHHLVKRLKPNGLLVLAMVFTGARLLGFAASATPSLALIVQLMNGLTFPAMWIAGVAFAHENAPIGLSATAQGMFGAMVFGFGAAVGGFIGGPLLESIGGRGLYIVLGTIVLLTVVFVSLLQKLLPAKPLVPPIVPIE